MFLVHGIEVVEGQRVTVGEKYRVDCKTRHGVLCWDSEEVVKINFRDGEIEVAFREVGGSFELWVPIGAIMFSAEDTQYDAMDYDGYC